MTTRWTTLIERSGDANIGAALIRLAKAAAGTHRLESQTLDRLASPGSESDGGAHARRAAAEADIDPTGTYRPGASDHFEEVDR